MTRLEHRRPRTKSTFHGRSRDTGDLFRGPHMPTTPAVCGSPAADHPHWILLARAGRDGCAGRTPRLRGAFDVREKYAQFDIVGYDGGAYIAVHDDPGTVPSDDGWQLLSQPGGRGPVGAVGPRGRKGERGARGEDAPTIVAWTLDRARTAVPTMSKRKGWGAARAPRTVRTIFDGDAAPHQVGPTPKVLHRRLPQGPSRRHGRGP